MGTTLRAGGGGRSRARRLLTFACLGLTGICCTAMAPDPARARPIAEAGTAGAQGRGIEAGFADPLFIARDPELRDDIFGGAERAGAGLARVIVGWGTTAETEPADPADPADPAYDWRQIDRAVRSADEHGMELLLTIHHAPDWAEGPDRPFRFKAPAGTWRPDPDDLREFAIALGTRYSGSYVPAGEVRPLPRVRLFEPWNEPNLTGFLSPQWEGRRQVGARLYRRLLNAFYDGVKQAQPGAAVIAGATGPNGTRIGGKRTKPLRFFRELFCLKRNRTPRSRCPDPAHFDLLSHHPITPSQSPRWPVPRGNASFQEMPDIRKLLRAAEREGTVAPAGLRRQLWATETWWETSPPIAASPDYDPPSERRQARYIADALRILWKRHVPVALLFQVRDSPDVELGPRTGWATGVQFADGSPKKSLRAVRFPFVANRVGRRKVRIWTRAPAQGRLRITARRPHRGHRTLTRVRVEAGQVVTSRVRYVGRGRLRARLDRARSLNWRVGRRP